jgi:hypothetical protein
VHCEWVNGHTYDLNRDPKKLERLNIVVDELFGVIRETARGPFGARTNLGYGLVKGAPPFIRGVKVTNNWKEILTHQLLERDL